MYDVVEKSRWSDGRCNLAARGLTVMMKNLIVGFDLAGM